MKCVKRVRIRMCNYEKWLPVVTTGCFILISSPSNSFSLDTFPEPDPPYLENTESAPPQVFHDFQEDSDAPVEWTFHRTADNLHPDGNEQQSLWLMNRARSNPSREGEWLLNTGHSGVESALNSYNVDKQKLRAEFNAIAPTPPAAFDVRLYNAAFDHSTDLIRRDTQDHDRQFLRVRNAGFSYKNARGNVYSYASDAVHGHAGFNIDWGPNEDDGMQAGRGHRKAIMSTDNIYTNVGIAAVPETNPGTRVGPLVITSNFCNTYLNPTTNHYNRFIVGTAWTDKNKNKQYDPGEGLAGVKVTPDSGPYFAITSNSGGYAIPMVSSGFYEVTFSGGALNATLQRSTDVASDSVLLDFIHDPNVAASAPTIIAQDAYPVSGLSAVIRANLRVNNDLTHYYFEYGEGSLFDKTSPTVNTDYDGQVTFEVTQLKLDTVYGYRLVAYNSAGDAVGNDGTFRTPKTPAGRDFWNLFLPAILLNR